MFAIPIRGHNDLHRDCANQIVGNPICESGERKQGNKRERNRNDDQRDDNARDRLPVHFKSNRSISESAVLTTSRLVSLETPAPSPDCISSPLNRTLPRATCSQP